MTGRVFEVREFCLHDGPGPRTTVFLQGCPLRCTWCQNPEGQDFGGGTVRTAEDVAAEIRKGADFLRLSGGGVTFSGGEPLAQPDFVCAVIDALAGEGLTFSIETSGYAPADVYRRVISRIDFVHQDLKHPDAAAHRRWTGVNPEPIFENLAWLKTTGIPFVVRIPCMPGVNDTPEAKRGFAALLGDAPNLVHVQLLPYNVFAGSKYGKLGRAYTPGFDVNRASDLRYDIFREAGLPVAESSRLSARHA